MIAYLGIVFAAISTWLTRRRFVRVLTPAVLAATVVTAAVLQPVAIGPNPGSSEGSVQLVFPASTDFPQDIFHLRRAFVGGSLSRAWVAVNRDGSTYAVSIDHEGSRANPVTWESELAGASHAYATLGAGDQTATQVGTAVCSAFATLGINECVNASGTVTITDVSGLQIGATPTYDTSLRGIWGSQRNVFGGSSSVSSTGAMGGTGSVHLTAPTCNGRALGVYMRTTGSANVRLGLADGPAYSTTPAAFSGGVEGLGVNNSGLRVLLFTDPDAFTSSEHKWWSFRGVSGGDPSLVFRNHTDTPAGRGDAPSGEQLLFSTTTSNPATAIYTAGAYTHGAEAGPYSIYAHGGFIYECPSGGNYPGNGAIVTRIGSHNTATAGSPTATVATSMDEETFSFRHAIPWDINLIDVRLAVVANSASEDIGLGIYRWLDSVAPTASSNPLLRGVGRMNLTTSTGYQTHTLSTPLALTSGWTIGPTFIPGNIDGVTPTTTVSVSYDPNPLGDDYWQTSWDDNGRVWNDMVPAGGGGLGVDAEYRTLAPGGDMPMGNPNPSWPNPFDGDASDDHSTENLLRYSIGVTRTGITGSAL